MNRLSIKMLFVFVNTLEFYAFMLLPTAISEVLKVNKENPVEQMSQQYCILTSAHSSV